MGVFRNRRSGLYVVHPCGSLFYCVIQAYLTAEMTRWEPIATRSPCLHSRPQ